MNSPSDVAKLSDAELADQLERAWQTYNRAEARSYQTSTPWLPHDPRLPQSRLEKFARVIFGFLGNASDSATINAALTRTDREVAMDEALKEIQALTAEMERRLAARKSEHETKKS